MKKEILGREAATDGLAAAPADGGTDGVASYSPPSSNRGGTETEDAGAFQEAFECYETYILDGKGNLLGVPLRRGVLAEDLLSTASTEIGALKTGIIAFGVVVVGIAIAIVSIGLVKRVINKA